MKDRLRIFLLYRAGNCVYIVDCARLVVYVDHGNQGRFIVHQPQKFFSVNAAVAFEGREARLRGAPVFQLRDGRRDGGMFACGSHDVSALSEIENRLIIRFRPAGGKHKLEAFGVRNRRKQSGARLFQLALQSKSFAVQRGRIKIIRR